MNRGRVEVVAVAAAIVEVDSGDGREKEEEDDDGGCNGNTIKGERDEVTEWATPAKETRYKIHEEEK